MYAGRRVGADIRAAIVGGDGRRGGGLCAARSEDGVGVGYRIGDCGSMPSDSHWLATMDGGGGGHGPSPWSGHRGRGGAGKARTGAGGAGGVGALDGGAAGGAADGAAGEAVDDTTERRDGGPTFALVTLGLPNFTSTHFVEVIPDRRGKMAGSELQAAGVRGWMRRCQSVKAGSVGSRGAAREC
ncbi:uncharacterized protein LOC110434841 [Sorghum bicolor]|uniref:uncharacterized protein LOC110434841 n=1 Tax=Sorghum bicolor TaxID=4558 RepID=UPI000B425467|nr:uncharacterized protein LOC110434841 [Sorghum bicolor]|eukprot:XP_021315266.1 uncharacterized protein LOC110434841 [Sorghum bicolor]